MSLPTDPTRLPAEELAQLRQSVRALANELAAVEAKLVQLRQSQLALAARLDGTLESPVPASQLREVPWAQSTPVPAAVTEEFVVAAIVSEDAERDAGARSEGRPAPFNPVATADAAQATAGPSGLEARIGGQILTWLGSIVLLLAVGFTVHWLWTTFQPPAWLRVLGLHGLAAALLAVGLFFSRRLPLLGQGLMGLGVFTLYATAYAAQELFGLYDATTAFVECALITVLAVVGAVRSDSVGMILLGALGGYATPIMTSEGKGSHIALFSYLAFLNAALLVSAVWRRWNFLKPLSWLATLGMFAMWLQSPDWPEYRWSTLGLAALHAILFIAAASYPALVMKRTTTTFDVSALAGAGLGFLGLAWLLFHELPTQQLALLCWGLAAGSLGAFAYALARVGNEDRLPRIYLALSAVFFTLAVPLQLDDYAYLGLVWSLEALIFTAVGIYFCDVQLRVSGLIVFMLAVGRLLSFDFTNPALFELASGSWHQGFLTILVSGGLSLVAGALHFRLPRRAVPSENDAHVGGLIAAILLMTGNLLLLLAISCQWQGRLLLVAATVDAAVIWALGFMFDRQAARWYGTVVGVAIAGGLALAQADALPGSFSLLLNARFGSLALLAAVYFAAGWRYWQLRLAPTCGAAGSLQEQGRVLETQLHVVLAALANLVLIVAITLEVLGWFRAEIEAGRSPFPDMAMARQAMLSGVWAVYAAALVGAGFSLRYRVHRLLGLMAFGPIVLKVFFVDLSNLQWMPRVLALAVLGMMLLGTSALYQRSAARARNT